jgi:hypothetical protein
MLLDNPLKPICAAWQGKIRLAWEQKKSKFQDDADECFAFFNGPHDFMYVPKYAQGSRGFVLSDEEDMPKPTFRMTCNRVAEGVQLFGPVLYHRNPIRQVNPRKVPAPPIELYGDPNNPLVQQAYAMLMQQVDQERAVDRARAGLMEFFLNLVPVETNLKDESRRAIDEALIKGMGLLWTELYTPPGMQHALPGSFYDTVDNLILDPDMESIKDAKWCARKCIHPVWQVEQEYGLKPGTLKGNIESFATQGATQLDEDADYQRRRGLSNDLVMYYKVYSKMGVGARLSGTQAGNNNLPASNQYLNELRPTLDQFGDYCYLVIVPDHPWPLNLPPELQAAPGGMQEIQHRLEWPCPFWALCGDWPFTPFIFHEVPRSVWPMSHFKPALGELKFLNWAYSFTASKIRTTCRDFIAVKKALAEEAKTMIQSGKDLSIFEMEVDVGDGEVKKCIEFLQHPQWNGDIWKVVEAVEQQFERRTGLTELLYGQSARQMRSAEEAQVKSSQLQVRPDDMSNKVEDAMTVVARKEALLARWHLHPQDVIPVIGQVGGQLWERLVYSSRIEEIAHQLEYRIEAGSARKPNRDRDAANMQQAMQALFQPMLQYAMQTGDFEAVNQLISDWAKSIDLDPDKYLFKPPPQMSPEQQQAQQAAIQQQMQQQQAQQQMQQQQAQSQQQLAAGQQKQAQGEAEHQQKLQHAHEQHRLALAHQQQKHEQELQASREKAQQQRAASAKK